MVRCRLLRWHICVANKAVDVKLEAATGGYYLYFMDGDTKTYIEIYDYEANKGGVRLVTSAPASVFVLAGIWSITLLFRDKPESKEVMK